MRIWSDLRKHEIKICIIFAKVRIHEECKGWEGWEGDSDIVGPRTAVKLDYIWISSTLLSYFWRPRGKIQFICLKVK